MLTPQSLLASLQSPMSSDCFSILNRESPISYSFFKNECPLLLPDVPVILKEEPETPQIWRMVFVSIRFFSKTNTPRTPSLLGAFPLSSFLHLVL